METPLFLALAPRVVLATCGGQFSGGIFARHGGDVEAREVPSLYARFADADARREWVAAGTPGKEDGGADDEQGWTHAADFSMHPLTPHAPHGDFALMARLTARGELDLALVPTGDAEGESWIYRRAVAVDSKASAWRGFAQGLRVADKATAAKIMLENGKLKKSACPKFIGFLMGRGYARYLKGTSPRCCAYYGHLWAYWVCLADGLLCITGFPLWRGDDAGYLALLNGGLYKVPIPPASGDLPDAAGGGGAFGQALSRYRYGTINGRANIAALWKDYGCDDKSGTIILRRPLAATLPSGGVLPLSGGDFHAEADVLPILGGGIYTEQNGALELRTLDNIPAFELASGGWKSEESIATALLPWKCHVPGVERGTAAQAVALGLTGHRWGNVLYLGTSIVRKYADVEPLNDAEFTLPASAPDPVPDPGDDPDPEPEPEPDPDPDPEPEPEPDPDPPTPPPGWEIGGGRWWVGGGGAAVTKVERCDRGGKVRFRFTFSFSLPRSCRAVGTATQNLTLTARTSAGGSYVIDDPPAKLRMLWGVEGGNGNVLTMVNTSDKIRQGNEWVDAVPPPTTAAATYPINRAYIADPLLANVSIESDMMPPRGNIYKLVNTGNTRRITVNVGGVAQRYEWEVWRLEPLPGCIKRALASTAAAGVTDKGSCTVSPPSVSGSSTGNAGVPTLTAQGAKLTPCTTAARTPYPVTGFLPLRAVVKLKSTDARFHVSGSFSDWSEVTWENRCTANIAGTFTVHVSQSVWNCPCL